MATKQHTGSRAVHGVRGDISPLITHSPRHGLLISTRAPYPETARDKIACAKSTLDATRAAIDRGKLKDTVEPVWILDFAAGLLEQAGELVDAMWART